MFSSCYERTCSPPIAILCNILLSYFPRRTFVHTELVCRALTSVHVAAISMRSSQSAPAARGPAILKLCHPIPADCTRNASYLKHCLVLRKQMQHHSVPYCHLVRQWRLYMCGAFNRNHIYLRLIYRTDGFLQVVHTDLQA